MPIKPEQQSAKEFKIVPEGTFVARCYSIVHIGHVPNTFPGAESATIDKIWLTWELPEELEVFKEGEEPRPYSISAEYTLSMNPKARLRPIVEGWLGKKFTDAEAADFDAETLVGEPCFLGITHTSKNEKTYANISSVTKLPKSTIPPAMVNVPRIVSYDNLTMDTFNKLPKFIQEKMQSSLEYKRWMKNQNGTYPTEKINADEIPF